MLACHLSPRKIKKKKKTSAKFLSFPEACGRQLSEEIVMIR